MCNNIPFNRPVIIDKERKYVQEVITSGKLSGGHDFNKKCSFWLEEKTKTKKSFLTTSCTHALEIAALLIGIKDGDEVIMPSYTFPSTANAFALRGAKIVFVDIRPDTMNIDENLIKAAITQRTKAVVPVHIAGVGCEMDSILEIAEKNNLFVIEDAAQGTMSTYKNKSLGAIGHMGTYSFHETKNYTCGEGGAILLNRDDLIERTEIIMEKGTNRSMFFRGEVDKYNWQDIGSSYVLSELNAAYLYAQLENAKKINESRLHTWNNYYISLKPVADKGFIELPYIPDECRHNAHMFYIKTKDLDERTMLLEYLKQNNINALFHYVPLHSSKAGLKYGRFNGKDEYTTKESERLIRLPLYYNMSSCDIKRIVDTILTCYSI